MSADAAQAHFLIKMKKDGRKSPIGRILSGGRERNNFKRSLTEEESRLSISNLSINSKRREFQN